MEKATTDEAAAEISGVNLAYRRVIEKIRCVRASVQRVWEDYKTVEDTAASQSLGSLLPIILALFPTHIYLSYYFATEAAGNIGERFTWLITLSGLQLNMSVVCLVLTLATVASVATESFKRLTAFAIVVTYLVFTSLLAYTPLTLGILDSGMMDLVGALILISSIYIASPRVTVPLLFTSTVVPVTYLGYLGITIPRDSLVSLWVFLAVAIIMSVRNWHSFYERVRAQNDLEAANSVLLLQKEILSKLAEIDELTSLATRRKFWLTLKRDYAKATRLGPKGLSSLLFINIDNLKIINDTHDHDLGDKVLSRVAKRILNIIRSTDIAGRLGNDEFAVFLPETDLEGAKLLAEKVRLDIEGHTFVFIDPDRAVTVRINATLSIGISCGRGSFLGVPGTTADQLFSMATAACTKAKQHGGNRWIVIEGVS